MVDNAWFIGEQISVFYDYKAIGLWQDTEEDRAEMAKWNENGYKFEPGMVRMEDMNGDYKLDPNDDRVLIGNKNPNWTMGWSNTFTYKGIELGCQIIGRLGYTFSTGGEALSATANQREVDYWTPENTGASYQKPILSMAAGGSGDSYSKYIGFQKASFLKMRNISLGYNVPKIYASDSLCRILRFMHNVLIHSVSMTLLKVSTLIPVKHISTAASHLALK